MGEAPRLHVLLFDIPKNISLDSPQEELSVEIAGTETRTFCRPAHPAWMRSIEAKLSSDEVGVDKTNANQLIRSMSVFTHCLVAFFQLPLESLARGLRVLRGAGDGRFGGRHDDMLRGAIQLSEFRVDDRVKRTTDLARRGA